MNSKDDLENKMRTFLGRIAAEADEYHAALLDAPHAVKQLTQSERGALALRAFAAFSTNEGRNLSTAQWKALSTLCLAAGYTPSSNT